MVSNRAPVKRRRRKVPKKQELDFDDLRKQLKKTIDALRKLVTGAKTRRGDCGVLCQDITRLIDASPENLGYALRERVLLVLLRAAGRSPIEVAHTLCSISCYPEGREGIMARSGLTEHISQWMLQDKSLLQRPTWRLVNNLLLDKGTAGGLLAVVPDVATHAARLLKNPEDPHALSCAVILTVLTHFPGEIQAFVDVLLQDPPLLTNLIAAGLDDDDDGAPSLDAESSQDLFELLLLNHHLYPNMIFRDGTGEGVGAILGLVESDVHAAKVCLAAWGTHEGGVLPLSSLSPEVSAMNMVMLAPHSRPIAELMLSRADVLNFIVENRDHVIADLIEVLGEEEAAPEQPKKGRRRKTKPPPKPTPEELLATLKKTLKTFVETIDKTSSEYFTVGDIDHRTEAGYALASARPGSTIFSQNSPFFGTCTVTKYPQWHTIRFNEVEQGIAFTGHEGVPGYNQGRPIPTVLGYDYIKAMGAALLKYGVVFPHKPVVAVGLGSGALPNFVGKMYTEGAVLVYEIDQIVLDACRAMKLQLQDNVQVVVNDAQNGFTRLPRASCSCILLDAYDGVGGIPAHLRDDAFLNLAGEKLNYNGSIISNLHNGPPGSTTRAQALDYIKKLCKAVGGSVRLIKLTTQQSNLVAVATKLAGNKKEATTELRYDKKFLEFEIDGILGEEFVFGEGEEDTDGLPKGLWGVTKIDEEDDEENEEEEEEEAHSVNLMKPVKQPDQATGEGTGEATGGDSDSTSTPLQKNVEVIELSSNAGSATPPAKKKKVKKIKKVKKRKQTSGGDEESMKKKAKKN